MDRTSEKSFCDSRFEIGGVALKVRRIVVDEARPTIVFLHDSLGCIAVWRDFPELLARAARCNALVYDRQGYGESAPISEPRRKGYLEKEAQTLLNLVDRYVPKGKVFLFGHSDGGTIALIAAGMVPERFAGVISEGAHVFVEEISVVGIKKAKELYETTNLKTRLEKYHGDKTDTVFSIWVDTWCSAEFRDWNMEHLLPKITCPVLVLQGSEDEYGTRAQVDSIARNVSGRAEPHLIPGVAHTPHKHAVEKTIRLASEFIGTIIGAR